MFAEPPPLQSEPAAAPVPDHLWRGRDVLAGLGLLILTYVLLVGAVSGIGIRFEPDDRELLAVGLLLTIFWEASFAAAVLFLARRRGFTLRTLGFRRPERWGPLPIILVAAYGSIFGYGLLVEYLRQLGVDVSWFEGTNQLDIPDDSSKVPLILLLGVAGFALMVTAPLAEEIFFRGLIYRALGGIWPAFLAMFVSGFLFSAFHVERAVLIPFTVIGMLFAWGFRASRSIWVPIITHCIFNSVSFAVTVYGVLD